jgi:hypothetical protein
MCVALLEVALPRRACFGATAARVASLHHQQFEFEERGERHHGQKRKT